MRGLRVLDHQSTSDPSFITDDGKTTFALLFTPASTASATPQIPKRASGASRPRSLGDAASA